MADDLALLFDDNVLVEILGPPREIVGLCLLEGRRMREGAVHELEQAGKFFLP